MDYFRPSLSLLSRPQSLEKEVHNRSTTRSTPLLNNENSTGTAIRNITGSNKHQVKNETEEPEPLLLLNDSTINYYSNLSCPFEWSKYSCLHQNRLSQGKASYDLAFQQWKTDLTRLQRWKLIPSSTSNNDENNNNNNNDHQQTKIVLVGDSTMRQVFIALACRFWLLNDIQSYYVDWAMDQWPCHGTPNCISKGNHSGFHVGHIELKSKHGLQFFYIEPRIVVERWMQKWNETQRLDFTLKQGGSATTHTLTSKDILVYNIGVHDIKGRTLIYKQLIQFGHSLLQSRRERIGNNTVPTLAYMTTITQHFPTETGMFMPGSIHKSAAQSSKNSCRDNVTVNPRHRDEVSKLRVGETIDLLFEPHDELFGGLHVGGDDCTHYCMPGAPDSFATRLLFTLSDYFAEKKNNATTRVV